MKKRYVISLLAIFIFSLSFFAYNKLLNNEVIEYSNTIGIYLEDDYESNTYKLSDSSDIPSDDYIFNAEKTNEECPNATFSYDSDSNKVQVNTNKSIKCNLYFNISEAPLEQLINYQFVYDGSLGEAGINGANTMSDWTGGWNIGTAYCYSTCNDSSATFNTNNIYITGSSSNGCSYYIHTKYQKDLRDYNSRYTVVDTYVSESALHYAGTKIVFSSSTNSCSISGTGVTYSGGEYKHAVTSTSSAYIELGIGSDRIGTISSTIYELWLTKADDYNTLASKIGVSVSSIDDLLNNYSTELLNNRSAVKYMVKRCTGDFMSDAIKNSTFMNAYASSPYKSLIDANEHWKKFIDMSTL